MRIRRQRPSDHQPLIAIWHQAVVATHDFVTTDDLAYFQSELDLALPEIEVHVMEREDGFLLGFIALDGPKVEMLFVHPSFHGQGIGRKLLIFAREKYGPLTVDVNEQNAGAHAFYLRMGFTDRGRSPVDSSGRPYPLIHMAQNTPENAGLTSGKRPSLLRAFLSRRH